MKTDFANFRKNIAKNFRVPFPIYFQHFKRFEIA